MANDKKTPRTEKLEGNTVTCGASHRSDSVTTSENWTPVDGQPGVYCHTGNDKVDWTKTLDSPDDGNYLTLGQLFSQVDDNTAVYLVDHTDAIPMYTIEGMFKSIPNIGQTKVFFEINGGGVNVVVAETEEVLFGFAFAFIDN